MQSPAMSDRLFRWLAIGLLVSIAATNLVELIVVHLPEVGSTERNLPVLVDKEGGPSSACSRLLESYETEHLARLEISTFENLEWRELADDFNVTTKQMRDGVDWLLDNCWE